MIFHFILPRRGEGARRRGSPKIERFLGWQGQERSKCGSRNLSPTLPSTWGESYNEDY